MVMFCSLSCYTQLSFLFFSLLNTALWYNFQQGIKIWPGCGHHIRRWERWKNNNCKKKDKWPTTWNICNMRGDFHRYFQLFVLISSFLDQSSDIFFDKKTVFSKDFWFVFSYSIITTSLKNDVHINALLLIWDEKKQ